MARNVRVVTVALAPASSRRALHRSLRDMLELAAAQQPDLVVLPEALNLFPGADLGRAPEAVPNETTALVADWARRRRAVVCCPLLVRRGRTRTNSTVWIGRDGEILGLTDKHRPTTGELEAGYAPASAPGVVQTDFGTVGAALCFDANFAEVGAGLARAGAELVVFPSMYAATRWLAHWALSHGYFVVSSYRHHSVILDPLGRLVAETGARYESVAFGHVPPLATATLNLDTEIFHYDFNQQKVPDVMRAYGARIELAFCQAEGIFSITATDPDLSVAEVIRRFDLEPRDAYFARAERMRRAASRKGGRR